MSFLAKMFEKKPGGGLVGNALRGVVSKVSGGAFGNGADLTRWEIANGYRNPDGTPTAAYYQYERGEMSPAQKMIAESAVNGAMQTPEAKETVGLVVAEKSWPWLLIAIVGGFLLWLFKSNQSTKINFNGNRKN